jgi:hypothetical protein
MGQRASANLPPLTLVISGLDVEEAKELASKIREFTEKDPTRTYACVIRGLESLSVEEVEKVFLDIFPPGGVAS